MAKQSGLGDNFYAGGVNLSGDIGSVGNVSGGPVALDMTGIDKSAMERIGGLRDGHMEYTAFFNPAVGALHKTLSVLPVTDVICTYCRGTALGSPAACMVGKQLNYDGTRANDGAFTFGVGTEGNGYGLEWGQLLTAGIKADTGAANGTGIDTTASAAFGAQAYLQVFAFTGTDVTVKIQDSADNATFADVTSFAFTQITGGVPKAERIQTGRTATIRRYLRAITITTGGFTVCNFAVVVVKNTVAVSF